MLLGLFGRKVVVLLLVVLAVTIGFWEMYSDPKNPVFHSYRNQVVGGTLHDAPTPFTILWSDKGASASTSGWNLSPGQNQQYIANYDGLGNATYSLQATSGNASIMITKQPLTNLAEAQGKILTFFLETDHGSGWAPNPAQNDWGWFLTTNNTAPAHTQGSNAQWDPLTDPSIIYLSKTLCLGGGNPCGSGVLADEYQVADFALKKFGIAGETIGSENVGGCSSGGSCIMLLDSTFKFAGPAVQDSFLNFTGTAPAAASSTCQVINQGTVNVAVLGNGCSFNSIVPDSGGDVFKAQVGSTTTQNWLSLTKGNIYFGIFSRVAGFPIRFRLDSNGASLTNQMNISVVVPGGQTASLSPQIDTGGFFGPLINALIGLGVFILNAILAFISFIFPALQAALALLESIVKAVLNAVGTAFGFPSNPGLGDDIFTFINSVITLFIVQVPNAFGQIGPIFTGWINTLVIIFTTGIVGQIFTFLSSVLTFGVNIASFAFTVFSTGLNWTTIFVPFWLMIWFFGFNADEGMNGWIRWFEFVKWLAFDIGVKNVTWVINWTIDVITAAMAILPKPFVQMAGKFPRIPIIDIHGAFSVPDFDGQYLKEGNLFSVLGMLGGFMGFVWYELTQTGIPGTLANEYPTQAWVTTASTAITFYELFLPMAVLVVFLLMVPTLFTSIFGVRVAGAMAMPVSVSTRRRSVVVHGRGSGKLIKASQPGKRTQAFIKGRLEKIEGREKEISMRNAREEKLREEAKETERVNKEAEHQKLSQQKEVERLKEAVKTQAERQLETEA